MNKILAIDDDISNLNLIKATLKKHIPASEVLISQSGLEGIQIAQDHLPDTIILDIMMPEVNGFEVCEKLKSQELTKHIPIIFFSAFVRDPEGIIKGLDLGAEAFLQKPIDPAELAAQVRVMLRIKDAEDNLKKQINKYRVMTETLPDAVLTINLNEDITYISERTLALFNYIERSELLHKNAFKYLLKAKEDQELMRFKEALSKNQLKDFEMLLLKKNGTSFNAEISASSIYNEQSKLVEYIILVKDISSRKESEHEILNYQNKLKSMNNTLTNIEEKERKMIAAYLHDGIGQTLSLVRINLTALLNKTIDSNTTNIIQESANLLNNAITETRALTFDLSPPILYELGLIQALQWKLKQIEEQHQIKTTLKKNQQIVNLDSDKRILIYRILTELFTNVIKHSKADLLEVNISSTTDQLTVEVYDNGIGFNYTNKETIKRHSGYGLFSIKERLDSIDGTLNISSNKDSGTKVFISIPTKIKNDVN